jgi:hypothetical protein
MQRPHGITAILVVHVMLYIVQLIFADWTVGVSARIAKLLLEFLAVLLVFALWKGKNMARQAYVLLALLNIALSPVKLMQPWSGQLKAFIVALTAFFVLAVVYLDTVKVRQWYGAGDWSVLRFWKFSPKASVPGQATTPPKPSAYSGLANPGL